MDGVAGRLRGQGTIARILAALFLIALYAAVGFGSPGYDDEFHNLGLLENTTGYAELVALSTLQGVSRRRRSGGHRAYDARSPPGAVRNGQYRRPL